ncbi:MAG: hypothetical protein WCK42_05200, partial [Myxococcaceae bacterium]
RDGSPRASNKILARFNIVNLRIDDKESYMSFVQLRQIFETYKISDRAKLLWFFMATDCLENATELWIKQQDYADKLHCSRSSIGRALKILIEAKLITDIKKRHLSRYKTYQIHQVIRNPVQISETSPAYAKASAGTPLKKLSKRELEDIKTQQRIQALLQTLRTPAEEKELNTKAREMLGVWKNAWKEKFPKLDGQSGRPYLESCVQKFAGDIGNWQYGRIPNHIEFMESCLKTVVERYCAE